MCFAIFLDLNIFLEEVGKSFVDAGGASTALKILQRISQFILKIDLIHRKYSDTPSIRSDTPDICSDIGSNTPDTSGICPDTPGICPDTLEYPANPPLQIF